MASLLPSPLRHVVRQGPVLASLGGVVADALRHRLPAPLNGASTAATAPGAPLSALVPPRDSAMVNDYIRWAGGDPAAWRGRVPHHLFPQWGFGLLPRTLAGAPYPLTRALNGGCKVSVLAPIPSDQPLRLTAQWVATDDDGHRAILTQRLTTALPDGTVAQVADVFVFVPLAPAEKRAGGPRKARPTVPSDAREVASHRFASDDGFRFACLTGDFNPVHWVAPYARAAGFGGTILHGFGTLARALEGLTRNLWAGDTHHLTGYEVRFTRPVRLPGRARSFVQMEAKGGGLWVGAAAGAPANLTGRFNTR